MDFSLTSEQEGLQDSVRRFCEREYAFERRQALLSGEAFKNWETFAELGWLGAGLPEELGGFGGGVIESALILEQMARALVVEPFLASAVIATQAVARAASTEQVETLLAPLVAGEKIACLAHAESAVQMLDATVETRATKTKDGYRLNGHKCFILGAPQADWLLVSARTSGAAFEAEGISLFLVPASVAGVERLNYNAVDGRRVSDIVLSDVQVGADARIGAEGAAFEAIDYARDCGLVGLCAEAVGAMDSALWLTRDYLKTRKQFGVTLATFQALQHRMADMLVETELARSMLYRAIAALGHDNPQARRQGVSAAKAQIGEAGYFVGAQAVQLHGGIGVTEEYIVGHYFKRLVLVRGLFGSTDQHLVRFAQCGDGRNEEHLSLT